jgi:hypothetical protein
VSEVASEKGSAGVFSYLSKRFLATFFFFDGIAGAPLLQRTEKKKNAEREKTPPSPQPTINRSHPKLRAERKHFFALLFSSQQHLQTEEENKKKRNVAPQLL